MRNKWSSKYEIHRIVPDTKVIAIVIIIYLMLYTITPWISINTYMWISIHTCIHHIYNCSVLIYRKLWHWTKWASSLGKILHYQIFKILSTYRKFSNSEKAVPQPPLPHFFFPTGTFSQLKLITVALNSIVSRTCLHSYFLILQF